MPTFYPPTMTPTATDCYPPTGTWQTWVTNSCVDWGTGTQPTTAAVGAQVALDPWRGWVTTAWVPQVLTGTGVSQNVWVNWAANTSGAALPLGGPVGSGHLPLGGPAMTPETAEQRAARLRVTLVCRNRSRASALRRRVAERRAEALLLENLTAAQRDEWREGRAFHVETAGGRRRYRIALGLAGNVRLVKCEGEAPLSKHGRPLREGNRFCAHVYPPDGWVPDADNCLAQKLLIESPGGEEEFLAMANVS